MKKHFVILFPTFLLTFILIGCASSELMVRKPFDTKLNQYSNFIFSASANVTDDVKDEISSLEETVMSRVKNLNLFKTYELGEGKNAKEGSLVIKAVITDINKVSGLTRFLFGAFAGKASMTIDVSFLDTKTGISIGEFTITGKSGGTGYAGGTSEAIGMTADKIAEVISQNYN